MRSLLWWTIPPRKLYGHGFSSKNKVRDEIEYYLLRQPFHDADGEKMVRCLHVTRLYIAIYN